ncbi:Antitoxin HigA-2 [compost metagenome]
MTKRDIFAELMQGFDDLAAEREGKLTLRTHKVEAKPLEPATGQEIQAIRKKLKMSQAVFAHALHAKPATLKNWEQNRSTPNDQATVLIRLLGKHPELIQELA